jgi:hypothetical protein
MKQHTTPSMTKRRAGAKRSPPPECYRLRDPRQLGQVFDAFEGLSELRRLCAREVASANASEQLFGNFSFEDDEFGLRRWRRLFDGITASWCILDQSVRDSRINLTEFQQLYRRLLAARVTWSHYAPRTVPLSLFDHIIDQVREVLISCAAQA